MQYVSNCSSPIGKILLCADETSLLGLWFYDQKNFASILNDNYVNHESKLLKDTKLWLENYFNGGVKEYKFPISLYGTEFQKLVWSSLLKIPYGKVNTYSKIAHKVAKVKKVEKMSARAVGSAIGKNPISIIVPCHRVIGVNSNLCGYAAGLDKKKYLLDLEGVEV